MHFAHYVIVIDDYEKLIALRVIKMFLVSHSNRVSPVKVL